MVNSKIVLLTLQGFVNIESKAAVLLNSKPSCFGIETGGGKSVSGTI
jgi:hypothetical protein